MTISRRMLLGGLSVLPFAPNLTGCSARAVGTSGAPAESPIASGPVGPGPNWNGSPLSGGTPPADPKRLTAKPAIHWLVPSGLVLTSSADIVIGVDADAGGTAGGSLFGVKQVDFWVEGRTQTVTTPSFYTDTDGAGLSRTRWGYWIKLRQSDFAAYLTGSEARIFATAVPNDTAMQSRIIGYDLVNNGLDDGNYPLTILPRATANDFSYTVNAANSDVSPNFTTLKKAMVQAAADAAERPLITFTATGNYEAENLTNRISGTKAFCVVTHAPSVVATINRATYTANNPSSWEWAPGWDGIEFRGRGIVFDHRNWTLIQVTRPSWFNGCKFTNSIGTRDTLYWNNGAQNLRYVGPGGVYCWVDSAYAEYVSGVYLNNYYAINCQWKEIGGSIFTGNHYVYNTYGRGYSNAFFRTVTNRLSIRYTPPGGQTTARASRVGSNLFSAGKSLLLKVDGATVATIPLGFYSTDTNPTCTELAAAINAVSGWTATVLNDGAGWVSAALGSGGGDWSFDDDVFNVTVNKKCTPDPHGVWWQGFGPSSTAQTPPARENVLHRNNVGRENTSEAYWSNDDASNGHQSQDHIFKGNVFLGASAVTYWGGVGGSSGANSMSHMVFENNTHEAAFVRVESVVGDLVYSSYRNNIVGQAYTNDGTTYLNSTPWINNFYIIHAGDGTPMTGGQNSGNVAYAIGGLSGLLRDYANADVRPAVGGLLLANLKPKVNSYDARGTTFSTLDVVGALASLSPAPKYPF